MIQYLKDSDRVVKVDTEKQSFTACIIKGDQMLIRHDIQNSTSIDNIVNGNLIAATEEEFLAKKAQILSAI